jgi:hypothetical protein
MTHNTNHHQNKLGVLRVFFICMGALAWHPGIGQSDQDALMMKKHEFCTGLMYQQSTWDQYWEGTLKRDNPNIGTMKTQMVGYMGMYGITNKLNVFASLPWVKTSSSAGQWKGQQGIQDVSLWLKYWAIDKKGPKGRFGLFGLAGVSMPVSDYSIDMLPYSIGLGTTNFNARIMADYQRGKWFATGSMTYVLRSNAELDRTAYYTSGMHYTNEIKMPDATQWMVRAGYRYKRWIAEAVADNWTTQGGHDITRNNMPFVSNRMEATRLGANFKWEDGLVKGLSLLTGGNYAVKGRNMGQATTLFGGIVYLFNVSKKSPIKADSPSTK